MAKMMKPEAEITRFGRGIDVIATSGEGGGPVALTAGKVYATLGQESYDADLTTGKLGAQFGVRRVNDTKYTAVLWESISNILKESDYATTPYAWYDYNGGGWLTNNQPYTGHEEPNHDRP